MTDPAALRALARDIAEEAGALAARRRAEGVEIAATKSSLADIVTAADREVEDLIRQRLAAERPEDGFYGEESGLAEASAEYTWIVDPIDGTVNYAKGILHYAVSIAVVTGPLQVGEWTALAGVVHQPSTGDTFVAARDEGAFLGSARLHVADVTGAGALLATGFGYDPATHEGDLAAVARVMPLARDLRRAGAASLDLAYVAAGRLDGYFERGLQPWDHAAGALLVEEAGGRVGFGAPDGFGRLLTVATTPEIFDAVLAAALGK